MTSVQAASARHLLARGPTTSVFDLSSRLSCCALPARCYLRARCFRRQVEVHSVWPSACRSAHFADMLKREAKTQHRHVSHAA